MRIKYLLVIFLFLISFLIFLPKETHAYFICDDMPDGRCSLTVTTGCTDTNPGICSVSAPGECNICTSGSSNDCCNQPGVSAWTKYAATCVYTNDILKTKGYVWIYDTAVCSTADKCTSTTDNPYLNAGKCECPDSSTGETGVGGQYKTCCNNSDNRVSSQSCTQMSVDNFNPPFEGVCPTNTTAKFCGFGGYPACGQDACGAIITPCSNSDPDTPALNSPSNGAGNVSEPVNLDWNDLASWGTNCATSNNQFKVFLKEGTNVTFTDSDVKTTVSSSITSYSVSNLKANTIYSWKVQATNGANTKDSAVYTFRTTPAPTATAAPTPTPAPAGTAGLSSSCPGNVPTLTATWNVGSGTNCNIYIRAGDGDHNIPTSTPSSANCNSTWSGSSFPNGGPAIVNGGIYHLYASNGTTTTDGGQTTVSCTAPPSQGWSGQCVTSGGNAYFNISGPQCIGCAYGFAGINTNDRSTPWWEGETIPAPAYQPFSREITTPNTSFYWGVGDQTPQVINGGCPANIGGGEDRGGGGDCFTCRRYNENSESEGTWDKSYQGYSCPSSQSCRNGDSSTFGGCTGPAGWDIQGQRCTYVYLGEVRQDAYGTGEPFSSLLPYTGSYSVRPEPHPNFSPTSTSGISRYAGTVFGRFNLGDGNDGKYALWGFENTPTTMTYSYKLYPEGFLTGYTVSPSYIKTYNNSPTNEFLRPPDYNFNFTAFPPRTISGRIFIDRNNNGIWDDDGNEQSYEGQDIPIILDKLYPTITTSDTAPVQPGQSVTVSWDHHKKATGDDWIGLYSAYDSYGAAGDTPSSPFNQWRKLKDCSGYAPSNPAAGRCDFTMPATPGVYEFRLFSYAQDQVANSTQVEIKPPIPPPSLSAINNVSQTTDVKAGEQITFSWNNVPNPNAEDEIRLYYLPKDNANDTVSYSMDISTSPSTGTVINCLKLPSTADSAGSCSFPITGNWSGGVLVAKYHSYTENKDIAASNPFTIYYSPTTLTAQGAGGATEFLPGQTVTVSWANRQQTAIDYLATRLCEYGNNDAGEGCVNGVLGNQGDYVRIFPVNSGWGPAATAASTFFYTYSCDMSPGSSGTLNPVSGSCPFTLPSTIPPGTYEFRMYWNVVTKSSQDYNSEHAWFNPPVSYIAASSNPIAVKGRTASQSSTYDPTGGSGDYTTFAAGKAVNGITNNTDDASITAWQNQPWWEADLGGLGQINAITIHSRYCCNSQTANMNVQILDNARNIAYNIFEAGNNGTKSDLVIPNITGQYVRIQRTDTNFLSLGEVQVWDSQPATLFPTLQAANASGGNAVAAGNSTDPAIVTWSNIPQPLVSDLVYFLYYGQNTAAYASSGSFSANVLPPGRYSYTIPQTFPLGSGTFRYYGNGSYKATSNPVVIKPYAPTLSAIGQYSGNTTVVPGGKVTVSFTRTPRDISYYYDSGTYIYRNTGNVGYLGDTVALYSISSGWGAGPITYVNTYYCNQTANPSGYPTPTNKSCTITIPPATPPGTYEFRMYSTTGYVYVGYPGESGEYRDVLSTSDVLALSNPITVDTRGDITLRVNTDQANPGSTFNVSWNNDKFSPAAEPAGADPHLRICQPNTSDGFCTRVASLSGSGTSANITMPSLPAGTYEVRLFSSNLHLATSNTFSNKLIEMTQGADGSYSVEDLPNGVYKFTLKIPANVPYTPESTPDCKPTLYSPSTISNPECLTPDSPFYATIGGTIGDKIVCNNPDLCGSPAVFTLAPDSNPSSFSTFVKEIDLTADTTLNFGLVPAQNINQSSSWLKTTGGDVHANQ